LIADLQVPYFVPKKHGIKEAKTGELSKSHPNLGEQWEEPKRVLFAPRFKLPNLSILSQASEPGSDWYF
jgi:hypothetical protein